MAVKPDTTYEAKVTAALLNENDNNTLGIGMRYETSDGPISHTWFVSDKTIDRLKENLTEVFGVSFETEEDVDDFLSAPAKALVGEPCSIVTELAKDRDGKIRLNKKNEPFVVVKWMNRSKLGRKAVGESLDRARNLFSGKSSAGDPPPPVWGGISDEDAPF